MSQQTFANRMKIAAISFSLFMATYAMAAPPPISLQAIPVANSHHVFVTNTSNGVQSVSIDMTGNNLFTDLPWPQVLVLAPGVTKDLGYLRSASPPAGYSFTWKWNARLGDYRATVNPNELYRLPYPEGQAYAITQAFGDVLTTHKALEQHAVDIGMPEGTPVITARSGTVVHLVDSFTEPGKPEESYRNKTNEIFVQHEDGTLAIYAHLAPNSAAVFLGQKVKAGERLALSGNTGFSSGPHLHFAIERPRLNPDRTFSGETIPFQFYTGKPVIPLTPKVGMLATADYSGSGFVEYQQQGSPQQTLAQAPTPEAPAAATNPNPKQPVATRPAEKPTSSPAPVQASAAAIAAMLALASALLASLLIVSQRRRAKEKMIRELREQSGYR